MMTSDFGMSLAALLVPAAAGFLFSLTLCLALVLTQRWHGHVTDDDVHGVQKFHRRPTPRVGGAAIAVAYAATWTFLPASLQPIWAMIGVAGVPALAAGLAEDLTRRVGVRGRLLATMISGVIFALLTGYVMDKVDLPGVDVLLSLYLVALLFTGFSMGGVANAVNIIDGFNGLAAGALVIMLGAFAFVAWRVGDGLVLSLALIYAAIVLGFFAVNFPMGRIFLGDGGAYFAGYLLAVLGVLLPARNAEISAWCAVLICAYPVIETLASMRRKSRRDGHSVGQPDRVHFHMLAHRYFARRMVPRDGGRAEWRNPATAVAAWSMPALTAVFAAVSYDNVWLNAAFFFLTVFIYGELYRVMSLNAPRLRFRRLRLPVRRSSARA
jgi:UDP-N-acetylmuramyl pentapeptide phosphotransferase/UDP-N-acetylglucosamine-1-phosphate transferase